MNARERAIALARKSASSQKHEYIPSPLTPEWMPHEWVIDAVMQAEANAFADEHGKPTPRIVEERLLAYANGVAEGRRAEIAKRAEAIRVVGSEAEPTAWVTECPHCQRTLHIQVRK